MTKPAVAGRTVIAPPADAAPVPKVVPVRHWGRGIGAAVVLLLVAGAVKGVATNDNLEWSVVGDYLFDANVLRGLRLTLAMTALGMVAGLVLAVVVGVMRTSASRIVAGAAAVWVFVFRGIPLVVLLIFVGNLGLFFDNLTIAIPLTGVELWSAPVSEVVTPFWASVTALALAGSGYMAEVVRAGLLSVGRGQHEAAMALGLPQVGTLRYIVLPQALRVIIPPLGNELIGMLKASAIVSVIAGGDLMTAVLGISGVTFRTIEMLIVGTIWYLTVIAVLSVGQYFLERKAAEK
ncbi:amino acid ABC transporter permease [Nocardioides nitrophenolicus]|uniref:amino acid ABC transporter permease n=1 Tax=Nocardioides nitrophenolicus TaxID=60489 RepID=UPI00195ADB4C|nr:amino acid ABC transporter permease [Nocardioides nitrophenolicus]MBM7518574.1 polar amino acid transport system permease protein [Nocardioides nitrophenolicus]